MRLIDAGALIAEMHNVILEDGDDRSIFYEVIERQPTIDPKTGRWIPHILDRDKRISFGADCSECGYWFAFREKDNYCPNCGARMEVEE